MQEVDVDRRYLDVSERQEVLSDGLSGSQDAGIAVAVGVLSRGLVLGDSSPGVSHSQPLLFV
jgi:hypothetical protein